MAERTCSACGGRGHGTPFEVRDEVNTISVYTAAYKCHVCNGTGRVKDSPNAR